MHIAVLLPLLAFASATLVPRQNNNTNNDDDDDLDFDLDNEGEFLRDLPEACRDGCKAIYPTLRACDDLRDPDDDGVPVMNATCSEMVCNDNGYKSIVDCYNCLIANNMQLDDDPRTFATNDTNGPVAKDLALYTSECQKAGKGINMANVPKLGDTASNSSTSNSTDPSGTGSGSSGSVSPSPTTSTPATSPTTSAGNGAGALVPGAAALVGVAVAALF